MFKKFGSDPKQKIQPMTTEEVKQKVAEANRKKEDGDTTAGQESGGGTEKLGSCGPNCGCS